MKIKFDTKEEIQTQREHIKKTYCDKASNLLHFAMGILIFSMITYTIALTLGSFDFGIFFEITALISTILALIFSKKRNTKIAKKYTIISALAIGWLVIFDILLDFPHTLFLIFRIFLYTFSINDIFFCIQAFNLIIYISAIKSLRRAEGTVDEEEVKDWFYDVK